MYACVFSLLLITKTQSIHVAKILPSSFSPFSKKNQLYHLRNPREIITHAREQQLPSIWILRSWLQTKRRRRFSKGDSPPKKDENRRILLMLRVRFATALESSAIFFKKSARQKIRDSVVRRRSFFPNPCIQQWDEHFLFVFSRSVQLIPAEVVYIHREKYLPFSLRKAAVAKCQLTTEEENTRAHGFPQN